MSASRSHLGRTTLCAWCGRLLHLGGWGPVSHGICPPCSAKLLEDARKNLRNVDRHGGPRGPESDESSRFMGEPYGKEAA